jgi:hypothetical protein
MKLIPFILLAGVFLTVAARDPARAVGEGLSGPDLVECVRSCVQEGVKCLKDGGDPEQCRADVEACKVACEGPPTEPPGPRGPGAAP